MSDLTRLVLATDDGCDHAPHCLTCPLPKCVFDMSPAELARARTVVRDAEIRRLHDEGVAVDSIAARMGITRRSVFRVLEKTRGVAA